MQTLPAFLKGYSDSSFTNPHEVVLPDDPRNCKGDFTHMGARYWGFETSRHRATEVNAAQECLTFNADAHHWLDIGLTHQSEIRKIKVSTKWFTGNQVPEISITLIDRKSNERTIAVARRPLNPDTEHEFAIEPVLATDCHVECYHEGGIARVNLLGTLKDPLYDRPNLLLDAAISHTSNEHYGKPNDAIEGDRSVQHMVGWESARSGFGESSIFTLPRTAVIDTLIVDTYMHRLNAPLSCHVFAAHLQAVEANRDIPEEAMASLPRWKLVLPDKTEIIPENFQQYMADKNYLPKYKQFAIRLHQDADSPWKPLVSFAALRPDTWHEFNQLETRSKINVIYYMHYPNGGVHGLKMFGNYSG